MARNGGHLQRLSAIIRETRLAGWGARIRTWEWRNQNPTSFPLRSTCIPKKSRNSICLGSRRYVIGSEYRLLGITSAQGAPKRSTMVSASTIQDALGTDRNL